MCAIFKDNPVLCSEIGGGSGGTGDKVVQHFIHCIESQGKHVEYLEFFQTVVGCCSDSTGQDGANEPNYFLGASSVKPAAATAIQKQQFIRKSQDMVMQEVILRLIILQ